LLENGLGALSLAAPTCAVYLPITGSIPTGVSCTAVRSPLHRVLTAGIAGDTEVNAARSRSAPRTAQYLACLDSRMRCRSCEAANWRTTWKPSAGWDWTRIGLRR